MDTQHPYKNTYNYAGFINVKTREPLVVKLTDNEDYNDVQERVHRRKGYDWKLFISDFDTKANILEKLNKIINAE